MGVNRGHTIRAEEGGGRGTMRVESSCGVFAFVTWARPFCFRTVRPPYTTRTPVRPPYTPRTPLIRSTHAPNPAV
jgi:hypothetical protein